MTVPFAMHCGRVCPGMAASARNHILPNDRKYLQKEGIRMKRIPALFLTGFLCLSLAACRKEPERLSDALESQITQAGGETVQQCAELVGPWRLDSKKNDLAAFSDSQNLFPGYGEWGASMEIRSNGQMSWYIGAEGWHGIYAVRDGVLHAQLTSDLEQTTQSFGTFASPQRAKCQSWKWIIRA